MSSPDAAAGRGGGGGGTVGRGRLAGRRRRHDRHLAGDVGDAAERGAALHAELLSVADLGAARMTLHAASLGGRRITPRPLPGRSARAAETAARDRTLRPVADRAAARRQPAHGAARLAGRPLRGRAGSSCAWRTSTGPTRRPANEAPPARRPRRDRPRLGRPRGPPERALRPLRRGDRPARRGRADVRVLLHPTGDPRGGRRAARARARAYPGTCRDLAEAERERRRRRAAAGAAAAGAGRADHGRRRPRRAVHRRGRRRRAAAQRRRAGVQPGRRRRRRRPGRRPRRPRRRPAAVDARGRCCLQRLLGLPTGPLRPRAAGRRRRRSAAGQAPRRGDARGPGRRGGRARSPCSVRWPRRSASRPAAPSPSERPARRLRPRRRRGRRPGAGVRWPTCNDPGRERRHRRPRPRPRLPRRRRRPHGRHRARPGPARRAVLDAPVLPGVVRAAGLVGFAADPDDPVPGPRGVAGGDQPALYQRRAGRPRRAGSGRSCRRCGRSSTTTACATPSSSATPWASRSRCASTTTSPRCRLRSSSTTTTRAPSCGSPARASTTRPCPSASLLAWPSLVTHPHEAAPLRRGVKHGLTIWFELPFGGLEVYGRCAGGSAKPAGSLGRMVGRGTSSRPSRRR